MVVLLVFILTKLGASLLYVHEAVYWILMSLIWQFTSLTFWAWRFFKHRNFTRLLVW